MSIHVVMMIYSQFEAEILLVGQPCEEMFDQFS